MAADACEGAGLVLPALSAETERELHTFLAPEASTRNPVDMIASASPPAYERALRLLLADPNVDAVLAIFIPPVGTDAPDVARAILNGVAGATKPVLSSFMGSHGILESLRSLQAGHVPSYSFPEAGARALGRAVAHARWRSRPVTTPRAFADADPARARKALEAALGRARQASGWLPPATVGEILAAYGLPSLAEREVKDAEAAVRAAKEIGYPVALKLVSRTITHKSDVGGVVLGLASEIPVRAACADIRARVAALGKAAELDGFLVQEMVVPSYEGVIGMTQDPQFGPLLMAGLGGTRVEIHRDVAFRLHPLHPEDAEAMLDGLRSRPLFDGYRASPPADRAAFADALLRVSALVGDLPELMELDLNPVAVLVPGRGVRVVDSRMRVGPEA
jgi:acyl-CoA synthetase (NDP forming)